MTTKVHPILRGAPMAACGSMPIKGVKIRAAHQAMNVLRLHMHSIRATDLAKEVGVSPACIYSIKSGRTKWPRPKTFFALLDQFGLEMHLK